MNVNIFPMALGIDNCYVVQGEGAILIDGGAPNQADRFAKSVAKLPVRPWEIKLIVATHEHPDHIGSAKEIKGLTGAAIAMHHLGKDCLEQGVVRRPSALSAWGRLLLKLMPPPAPGSVPPTGVDLVLGDEAHSLAGYGIPGKVIHTPGHSPGSVSVLLETGDAFVGDLAVNRFPLRLGPGLPSLGDDLETIRASWRRLLDEGVTTVYPAHGRPFPVGALRIGR